MSSQQSAHEISRIRSSSAASTENSNPTLGDMEISGDLLKLQDEWEHLLSREELKLQAIPPSKVYSEECEEKYNVCALWMDDGTMGFSIDYPYDAFEVKCYWLRQSKAFTKFYFFCCFIHIISPFLEEPMCPWEQRGEYAVLTTDGGFFSPMLINVINLFCILVYILDLFLWLRVNSRDKSMTTAAFYKNEWLLIRCVICFILFLDTLVYFGTGRPVRFAKGLVPFVFISRRVSMRQLLQGLVKAMTKTVNVLMLFSAMVFIYGYTGFLIFNNVDTEKDNRFDSLQQSILTVLHVLAGRSYNAFVGNQYFEVSFMAGFFFVTLMIAGDFLCTNLIIAVGNREFKIFSNHIYKRQLRNRRQALVAIHEVLSDKNGRIGLPAWRRFCCQIRGAIRVRPEMADVLFNLESVDDKDSPYFNTIDCIGLFRLSALIAARVDLVSNLKIDPSRKSSTGLAGEAKTSTNKDMDFDEGDHDKTDLRPSTIIKQKEESILDADVFGVEDIRNSALFGKRQLSDNETTTRRKRSSTTIEMSNRNSNISLRGDEGVSVFCGGDTEGKSAIATSLGACKLLCNTIISANISVKSFCPFLFADKEKDIFLNPFALFFSGIRILLAFQLVQISGHDGSLSWLQVGWVIQAFLMLESLILVSALGINEYLHLSGGLYSLVLNVLSLGFVVAVGTNASQQGRPAFILLLVVQVFRFFRSFCFLRDYDFMMSLLPLIVRMLLLYASIIYFFAVIGHTRLCNSFPSDMDTADVDDDGASWEEFSGLLNFSTLLKTFYTLYEVSILGNWSIVMGAASRQEPVVSFLFFLPYRLLMAMLVIPLLFSFIMQAFIAHRDKLERKEIVVDKLATYSNLDRYCYSQSSVEESSQQDPEQIKRSVDEAVDKIMRKNESSNGSTRARGRKIQRRASMRSVNLSKSFMDMAEGNFFGPDLSVPTLKSDEDAKAIHSGEKGQSMMSFWSGGAQGPSNLHRDERNAAVLASMLEEALFQLGMTMDSKADTQEKLRELEERNALMSEPQLGTVNGNPI